MSGGTFNSLCESGLVNGNTKCHNETVNTLNISNVHYTVKVYKGRWWQGACFRKRTTKQVLNSIHLQLRSGEIAAVLGNSGEILKPVYLLKSR